MQAHRDNDQWRLQQKKYQTRRERDLIFALYSAIDVSLTHYSLAFLIKYACNVSRTVFCLLRARVFAHQNVVHSWSTPCCGQQVCIGQTGRCRNDRLGEHAENLTNKERSHLADHCMTCSFACQTMLYWAIDSLLCPVPNLRSTVQYFEATSLATNSL